MKPYFLNPDDEIWQFINLLLVNRDVKIHNQENTAAM